MMKSQIKKINQNQVELSIGLDKEELARYISKAESEFGQNLQIDGFRKGKAPREFVRKHIPEDQIKESAIQSALQGSLSRALDEQSLDAANVSQLSVKENTPQNLNYSVLVTLYPDINVIGLGSIKVQRKKIEVDPKEVAETLATIQSSRSTLAKKDAPAAEGDRVEVDFEVSEDGHIIKGGVSKSHPLVIGKKNFIPGFEDELVGMKKDDEKSFSLKAPKNYHHKEVAGKKLDFKVKITDVKQVVQPELNDEFVKSLGRFQNMEQLILNIKEGLTHEKEDKETERVRLEVLDKVIEKSKMALPEAMVNEQLDRLVQNFDADLHQHNMELSLYLAQAGKTQDDLRKEWQPEAERQVKIALVLHKIGREKQIVVDPAEVDEAVSELVQAAVAQNPGSEASLDLSLLRSRVASQLMSRKTLEFIEGVCVEPAL